MAKAYMLADVVAFFKFSALSMSKSSCRFKEVQV